MQDSDFADSLLFVTVCYTTASFVGEYFFVWEIMFFYCILCSFSHFLSLHLQKGI